jgi:hypothetical protein
MKYPLLTEMIHGLSAAENLADELPEDQWIWPSNVAQLEEMAGRLTEEERGTVLEVETEESKILVEEKDIAPLTEFFDMVFDGEYTQNFYASYSSYEVAHGSPQAKSESR